MGTSTQAIFYFHIFLKERISVNIPVFLFSLVGHVFPEFKESDAMFAAERVSSFVFLMSLMWSRG